MRIYAVADVHGKSTRIEGIRKTISEFKPDVLVVAGDITNIRNYRENSRCQLQRVSK